METLKLINHSYHSSNLKNSMLIMLITLTGFTACNLFRQKEIILSDSLHTEHTRNLLQQKDSSSALNQWLGTKRKSSTDTWLIELSPEEVFSYSPQSGFTGRAKSLRISGMNSSFFEQEDKVHSSVTGTRNTEIIGDKTMTDRSLQNTKTKLTKKKPSIKVYGLLILLAIGMVLLWIFRKKITRFEIARN